MEYPKINSLFKRENHKGALILGDYACPEFGAIKEWRVEEKIDGTNIRVHYADGKATFHGRTGNAQIASRLVNYMHEKLTIPVLAYAFPSQEYKEFFIKHPDVWLFGEGYGANIQQGAGCYSFDPGFCLFDVYIDGFWLERESVYDIADKLGVEHSHDIGMAKEETIVDFVKSKPLSCFAQQDKIIEGVVCRTEPTMLFRKRPMISDDPVVYADYYVPVMWKLKCKDFE